MLKPIGERIKERRLKLGLTRDVLGARVGVTGQTILNLEQDPEYNLGTRLLGRLGEVLGVDFEITMTEKTTMKKRIRMGNDELIFHIRKHYKCPLDNPTLGKFIGEWLATNANGEQLPYQYATPYMIGLPPGQKIPAVSKNNLPKGSVIFEFDLDQLPALYERLEEWGGTALKASEYIQV
jgi:transcriptional regulator with XRE-family HTH domain